MNHAKLLRQHQREITSIRREGKKRKNIEKKEDVKLRNVKTCNHCAAFLASMTGAHICTLGYKTQRETNNKRVWVHFNSWEDLFLKIKPAEPCPKPKNVKECVAIRKVIDVHRYSTPGTPEYEKEYGNSVNMTEEESLHHYVNLNKQ